MRTSPRLMPAPAAVFRTPSNRSWRSASSLQSATTGWASSGWHRPDERPALPSLPMQRVEIRRVRAEEWTELRALRLAALRDNPLAFGSTYEQDLTLTPDRWQRWAAEAAAGAEYIAVAVDGRRWIAMARGSANEADPRSAWLTAVHVAPDWRGQGLGRTVSEAVIEWARKRGFDSIRLHVADWNEVARRLYDSLGFELTGATEPLPHDPSVTELEMRLLLR